MDKELKNNKWSIALCPDGKILEIKEGLVSSLEMLPPCSSNNLPEWIGVIEYAEYKRILDTLDDLLKEKLITQYVYKRLKECGD